MKLSELLVEIGDDNLRFQNLDQCVDQLDWSAKKGTRITFDTEIPITPNGLTKLGLVVWLDREQVKAAMAKVARARLTLEGGSDHAE